MCSRIKWTADGQPVLVGRNMDWTARMGTKLYTIPKGVDRSGLVDQNPLSWTSKYGSIVATVWDCAAADGLNDVGLNANFLYLAEAQYGERDPSRPGLSIALWVQYLLDTCATVAEAVEATKSVQIQPIELVHKGARSTPHCTCLSRMRAVIRQSLRSWMVKPSSTTDRNTL